MIDSTVHAMMTSCKDLYAEMRVINRMTCWLVCSVGVSQGSYQMIWWRQIQLMLLMCGESDGIEGELWCYEVPWCSWEESWLWGWHISLSAVDVTIQSQWHFTPSELIFCLALIFLIYIICKKNLDCDWWETLCVLPWSGWWTSCWLNVVRWCCGKRSFAGHTFCHSLQVCVCVCETLRVLPDGRLVPLRRAGAVPSAAPCRARPAVHWPQLLQTHHRPWVQTLPDAQWASREGGGPEEGAVLPQQPSGRTRLDHQQQVKVMRTALWSLSLQSHVHTQPPAML